MSERLRLIDMFAGIGGFSLGLHRAGLVETVAVAETDPHASKVIAKHFPAAPNVGDVTVAEYPHADIICAGFPCQDISFAGAGAGLAGSRSGLWREVVRAIRVVRPKYAILENVAALLSRGMGTVLGDLAEVGHDAEWHCIQAGAIGAPHLRDRIWIFTQPQHPDTNGVRPHRAAKHVNGNAQPAHQQICISGPLGALLADAKGERRREARRLRCDEPEKRTAGSRETVADPDSTGLEGRQEAGDAGGGGARRNELAERRADLFWRHWAVEPNVGRVAHGIPKRVDRLRCLGNAVVPQIPELIGRAILSAIAGEAQRGETVEQGSTGTASTRAARHRPNSVGHLLHKRSD